MHKLENLAGVHTYTSRILKDEKRVEKIIYSKNNENKFLLNKNIFI